MIILGFDIGGTKCAVVTAEWNGENLTVLKKNKCATDLSVTPEAMISKLIEMADEIIDDKPDAIGISCGGPLDSEKGVILSPPNLPGWDEVEISKLLSSHYGVSAKLQNDANASAVAEWKFGAGKGTDNMIFLTFGTGLGADIKNVFFDIDNNGIKCSEEGYDCLFHEIAEGYICSTCEKN